MQTAVMASQGLMRGDVQVKAYRHLKCADKDLIFDLALTLIRRTSLGASDVVFG